MNFNYRRFLFALLAGIISVFSPHVLCADTTLLFTKAVPDAGLFPLSQANLLTYGDRVTANVQGPSNFLYGGSADTPNIVVDYSNDDWTWKTQFGDLLNVLFTRENNIAQPDKIIKVTLTADPGFAVQLHDFDLASWANVDRVTKSVKVFNELNNVLFSQNNVFVEGDGFGSLHTTMSFPSLISKQLRIEIDASNITDIYGSENIGLDNVRFSQTAVPEPCTMLLSGIVVIGLIAATRQRKTA